MIEQERRTSEIGTNAKGRLHRIMSEFGMQSGKHLLAMTISHFDPFVWSGRALQVVSPSWRGAVLHQCIRPLIGAFAPGHHGYQRACVLISGQASIGPFGSPVFARARKTEPPSRLILSQTSAGSC